MQNVKNCFDKIFFAILSSIFQIFSKLFARYTFIECNSLFPLSVVTDKNVFHTPRNKIFEIFFYAIFVSNCLKNQQCDRTCIPYLYDKKIYIF